MLATELTLNQTYILLSIDAFGSIVAAICFVYSIVILLDRRRKLAIEGNDEVAKKAASKLILPCYRPLYQGLFLIFSLLSIGQFLTLSSAKIPLKNALFIIQFYSLNVLTAVSICPILFTQKFISKKSFIYSALMILPWYLICTGILLIQYYEINYVMIPEVVFLFVTFLPSFIVSVGILTRSIPSRVRLESVSHRNAVEHCFIFTIIYSLFNLLDVITPTNQTTLFYLLLTYCIVTCLWVILFPLALHRSLLADTKFFLGRGTHNQGIFNTPPN